MASSKKYCAIKLDEALWTYKTEYKTPRTLSILIYCKACHHPIELEHKAFWALRLLNFDPEAFREKRKTHLLEL